MPRPKHPDKELEAVLKEAERKRWRITKGRKYYMMWCPCPGRHKKGVKLSPSGGNYKKNLLGELHRRTCWGEAE